MCTKSTWYAERSGRYGTTQLQDAHEQFDKYAKRIAYLRFAGQQKKNKLLEELEKKRQVLRDLSSQSLKQLLAAYGTGEVFEGSPVIENRFLVFLLRKGYITEEYSGAMNYFKANSITRGDRNFILSIKNQDPYPFSYALIKVAETIERLQVHEFSEKAILNFDLLEHMLKETRYNAQLEVFFKQLADESPQCWSFIDEFIGKIETQKRFVELLSSAWLGLWDAVFYNGSLTYERKVAYLGWLLDYTDIETLKAQNNSGKLVEFVIANDSILQKLSPDQLKRLLEVVPALDIKFVKIQIAGVPSSILDRIFDERFYEINPAMIESIVAHKDPALVSELQTANYTTICKLAYNALTENIHDNVESYIEQVVLQKGNVSENTDAVLDLLDWILHNHNLCRQLVAHEVFQIMDISRVYEALETQKHADIQFVCDLLLELQKICASWENVHQYWQEFEMTDSLIAYITANSHSLASAESSVLDDSIKKAIILSNIGINEFTRIQGCLRLQDFDFGVNEIDKFKLEIMIRHQCFDFTVADFDDLMEYAPELCTLFIAKNQEAFADCIGNIELNQQVFVSVIESADIAKKTKELVVEQYGEDLISKDTAILIHQLSLTINRTIFTVVWPFISGHDKFEFMIRHLPMLESADFDRCFGDLGYPFAALKRTSGRHDEVIPDSYQNRLLVERLHQIQHITSFTTISQDVKISKSEHKSETVLRCRVKAKTDDA